MLVSLLANEKLFKVLLFICLIGIEFLATTTIKIEAVESMWDKSNHFIAFFTLYIFISLAFKNFSLQKKVLWLLLFAFQIEIVQYFIEGRFFSFMDIIADAIGILIGIVSYKILLQRKFLS